MTNQCSTVSKRTFSPRTASLQDISVSFWETISTSVSAQATPLIWMTGKKRFIVTLQHSRLLQIFDSGSQRCSKHILDFACTDQTASCQPEPAWHRRAVPVTLKYFCLFHITYLPGAKHQEANSARNHHEADEDLGTQIARTGHNLQRNRFRESRWQHQGYAYNTESGGQPLQSHN